MSVGQNVYLPDGRLGMIVGWHGEYAIVSLGDEVYVEVLERALRVRR